MTGSNNPRFRLLIGWCCLMSAALLMMTVFVAIKKQPNTNTTVNCMPDRDPLKGSPPGQSFKDYIRLIKADDQKSWMCSFPCENSSLALKKNISVEITISGLYFINAQFLFTKSRTQNPENKKREISAILLRNQVHGKGEKKLSEVKRHEEGSVSLIRMVYLKNGDSIRLDVQPHSMELTTDEYNTYWEITLLSNQ
ncbi:lymphotoxin-alpha isoform X2 [Paramisgurnus dabryanus]|uniref:lymphotoxin-alpha isoform X2 n=1 Tax=Paramisgurnus dabryanus TaxID=90735 RepID=UPI0031F43455